MTKGKKKLVGQMGLVLMSVVGTVIGLCIGAAIVVGLLRTYSSI